MELKLIPVTADNWRDAVFLTTDPEGKIPLDEKWVASNAFSLLQCRYDPDWDCRLMMDGETAVGFVFYGYDRDEDHYLMCRYMMTMPTRCICIRPSALNGRRKWTRTSGSMFCVEANKVLHPPGSVGVAFSPECW